MTDYSELQAQLRVRLDELIARADVIEDDLRHPLESDLDDQAIDLADDEALAGVDDVLKQEIAQVRMALYRIEKGTYGRCAVCGEEIAIERLRARPIATRCVRHAS